MGRLATFAAPADIAIRAMTTDMLPEVCALHVAAFGRQMSARLGTAYLRAFMAWFVRSREAIALVAVDGGDRVLGYVIGAADGYATRMNREMLGVASASLAVRPWLLFERQVRATLKARLATLMGRPSQGADDLPRPTMSLVGIAVSPAASGRGVGGSLVRSFEQEALGAGMASVRLSVYPQNDAARRLYERCGWYPLGSISPTGTMSYGRVIS